jgi:hypothetical protein
MHNLSIRRLLAAALILTALAGGSVGCGAEGGTAPPPAQHGSHTYRFVAEGTPRRAHIFLKIGSFVHVDAARNLPWDNDGKRITVAPHQFVEFSVTVIDITPARDVVTCTILDAEGREKARSGPAVHANCPLAALEQPA